MKNKNTSKINLCSCVRASYKDQEKEEKYNFPKKKEEKFFVISQEERSTWKDIQKGR